MYIGGHLGYEWGTSSTTATNTATGAVTGQPDYNPGGIVGGMHSGFNYQISHFVVGFESSINGSSYRGTGLTNGSAVSNTTKIPFETLLRGRVGVAWDRALIFVAAGMASGNLQHTSKNTVNGLSDTFYNSKIGWTVGGGIEYAITDNWSVRTEYLYTDYGKINEYEGASTGGAYLVSKHETDSKVQVGFSYKFDQPPWEIAAGMFPHGN